MNKLLFSCIDAAMQHWRAVPNKQFLNKIGLQRTQNLREQLLF